MSVFLPFVEQPDDKLITCLSRLGPLLVTAHQYSTYSFPDSSSLLVLIENQDSVNLDQAISWLDGGVEKIVIPLSWAKELNGVLPPDRLLLLLDVANVSAVSESIRNSVSGVLLKTPTLNLDLISSVSRFFPGCVVHVFPTAPTTPSRSKIREIFGAGASLVISTTKISLSPTTNDRINIADAFLAATLSDRPDGLFPTVVTSHPQGNACLGLVYSSYESVKESIITGKGVYQSRKHGLWRKGETSGAIQDVIQIRSDCDSDALQFSVVQHGDGFCHLARPSCFGQLSGFAALEQTLRARHKSVPQGSYTARLFQEPGLLQAKIMEEADELCRATTPEEVAFEAADLLYFSLTRCIAAGVGLSDIERSLDAKAKKITRRKGDAKPRWANNTESIRLQAPPSPTKSKSVDQSAPICMQTFDLSSISSSQRIELLRRPVLRSGEMISKVQPIVDEVRTRGDSALLELTAKFDKVHLTSPVIFPPFASELMQLDISVRDAIDKAYSNIQKFHQAQAEKETLVIETMPGVVCSRFVRPIARVGLYVPGGTAILPSTALMLGIPAQVAGCREIVLATPPRPDGSISPEVMYVAHLVGASAVLKAGGAQAVAAMAYGTQTVPKVDKIFGPGNQWVTAAKMLVQNDTDALVSIDMPAGPSEVLVIADESANPGFVAADLLSQAEHGVDSQVVLVTVDLPEAKVSTIEQEVASQARALDRVDIIRQSILQSIIVKASNVKEAVEFSNDYAPEHLILHLRNAQDIVSSVQNAGSVFVGPYSPESCGDYASGTNHTLPTNGYARQFSGVNTLSFQKHITSQEVTADGLKGLGPIVATLADCEGLGAHANAVRIRLRSLGM